MKQFLRIRSELKIARARYKEEKLFLTDSELVEEDCVRDIRRLTYHYNVALDVAPWYIKLFFKREEYL